MYVYNTILFLSTKQRNNQQNGIAHTLTDADSNGIVSPNFAKWVDF